MNDRSNVRTAVGMVNLEYFNGEDWVPGSSNSFYNEIMAWLTLGGDDLNYRTVDAETGEVLTDKSNQAKDHDRT